MSTKQIAKKKPAAKKAAKKAKRKPATKKSRHVKILAHSACAVARALGKAGVKWAEADAIIGALEGIEGVTSATSDFSTGATAATYDAKLVSNDVITTTIEDLGYKVVTP